MLKSIFDAMINFFNLVGSLVNFVIDMVKDLVYVITLIGKMLLKIPSYVGWLPTTCGSIIVAIFGIVVIYKILGREG